MPTRLLLATTNPAKCMLLGSIVEGLALSVERGVELPEPDIDEAASSHLGNAIQKAVAWSERFSMLALASDGGLVIPALGDGWESTLTHRATGEDVSDEERARRLLSRMRDLSGAQREAYWAEAVAVAREGVLVSAWETDGMVGLIGEAYKPNLAGPAGFWADGLWETSDGRKRWELSDRERSEWADPWAQLRDPVRSLLARFA